MRIVAIIPARGDSTRLLHKNIIDFCGKPLIVWTIEAAVRTLLFDKIYVSTDDEEIAEVAAKYPIEVLLRNPGYSDNYTTVQEATIRSLKQIEQERGESYNTVTLLMACCPLRTAPDIVQAHVKFNECNRTFQLSACEYDFLTPWWAWKLTKKGKPNPLFPKEIKMRSQDLPKLYCPVGAIWIAKVKELYEANTFYGPGYDICPIEFTHAIDIDTENDLHIAKALMIAGVHQYAD